MYFLPTWRFGKKCPNLKQISSKKWPHKIIIWWKSAQHVWVYVEKKVLPGELLRSRTVSRQTVSRRTASRRTCYCSNWAPPSPPLCLRHWSWPKLPIHFSKFSKIKSTAIIKWNSITYEKLVWVQCFDFIELHLLKNRLSKCLLAIEFDSTKEQI